MFFIYYLLFIGFILINLVAYCKIPISIICFTIFFFEFHFKA